MRVFDEAQIPAGHANRAAHALGGARIGSVCTALALALAACDAPAEPMAGFVYRVEADRSTTVLEDLASIRARVPETSYTGIHGVASGLDGAIYFTNQNTSGSTFEPFGQLLVRRPDGTLRLLASGFNFDWPRGYDGDLVVGTRSLETITVPVRLDGSFEARLDAPDVDGAFEVRASVVDPATGRVFAARRHARTS